MKRCPECRRDYYDDTLLYCLEDGTELVQGSVPIPASEAEEPTTAILSVPPAVASGLTGATDESELRTAILQPPATAGGSDRSQRRTWTVAGVALALVTAGIGFAVYKFWPKTDKPPQAMKIERLTTNGKSVDAAISPDGKYVVYILDEGGQQSLRTRHVATTSDVEVIPPSEVQYSGLVFSPDSNHINFVKQEKSDAPHTLYQMPVLAGAQKKLITGINGTIDYSPDGKQLAFVRYWFPTRNENSLFIANTDGTGERVLATIKSTESFLAADGEHPAWAPDGRTIACVVFGGAVVGENIVEVKVSDGTVSPTGIQAWKTIQRTAWLPDKSGLMILGADKRDVWFNQPIWSISYPGGETRRITTDFNNYIGMSLTADANTLAAVQSNRLSNIWVAPNGDSSRAVQIKSGGSNLDGVDALAWTPDGRIVYYSLASRAYDIWIMNGDGTGQKQLTVEAGANHHAKVTPDGRYIVFVSERDRRENVWRMDPDGGNPTQLTSSGAYGPSVSRDSKWVIYVSYAAGTNKLWKVSIDGGDPVQLTDYPSRFPEVSPDGKLIAFRYRETPNVPFRYAIVPIEGGKPVKVFDLPGGTDVYRWSKDSSSLAYIVTRNGVSNIWRSFPLDGTPPKQLTNFKTEEIYNFDWYGKQLVLARGTTTSDVVLIKDFR